MKKNIIVALVILLGSVLCSPVGTVFAQGASCDAGGGTEGVLNAEGVCVSTQQTPTGQDTTQQSQSVQSGFTALAPVPGLTDTANTSVVNSDSLATFFNNLYKYLIGLAAILALGEIIWAGIKIATNQDNVSTITDSKGRIAQALLGLTLVLSPVLVFSIINPSILNLSVNLPALDTTSPAIDRANNSEGDPNSYRSVVPPADSCKMVASNQYLETAVCPTKELARDYSCQNGGRTTLQWRGSECRNKNINTGECLDTYPVVCEGQPITVVYYYTTHYLGYYRDIGDAKVVPRDSQVESTFATGCSSAGGRMTKVMVGSEYDCPGDANIPLVNTNDQYDIKCATERLTCGMSRPQ